MSVTACKGPCWPELPRCARWRGNRDLSDMLYQLWPVRVHACCCAQNLSCNGCMTDMLCHIMTFVLMDRMRIPLMMTLMAAFHLQAACTILSCCQHLGKKGAYAMAALSESLPGRQHCKQRGPPVHLHVCRASNFLISIHQQHGHPLRQGQNANRRPCTHDPSLVLTSPATGGLNRLPKVCLNEIVAFDCAKGEKVERDMPENPGWCGTGMMPKQISGAWAPSSLSS